MNWFKDRLLWCREESRPGSLSDCKIVEFYGENYYFLPAQSRDYKKDSMFKRFKIATVNAIDTLLQLPSKIHAKVRSKRLNLGEESLLEKIRRESRASRKGCITGRASDPDCPFYDPTSALATSFAKNNGGDALPKVLEGITPGSYVTFKTKTKKENKNGNKKRKLQKGKNGRTEDTKKQSRRKTKSKSRVYAKRK